MKRAFQRILIVRTDRIGDVVLTIPAIRALKRAYPAAHVAVWVNPSTRDLIDGLPYVDEIVLQPQAGWMGYLKLLFYLLKSRFDLAVIYHTKRKTNLMCWLAGIPMRLGYFNNKFGWALTCPVKDERHLGVKHELDYCFDLLKVIDVPRIDDYLELALKPETEVWADNIFCRAFDKARPVIALHPDASCSSRHWPVASFAALSERLQQSCGAQVVIIGSATTKKAAAAIAGVDYTGCFSMAQTIAFLRRCSLLISNDSGPVHLAAAVNTPVISLFLRVQPGINKERWRPLGGKSVVLHNKPGEEIKVDARNNIIGGRFDSISVEEVYQAAIKLI